MNCAAAIYLIPLYLSGELDSTTMAQFDHHANECSACRRHFEEQKELDLALRISLLTECIDVTRLHTDVMGAIRRSRTAPTDVARHSIRIAFAFAAVLILMVTLGVAYRDNTRYEQASIDHVDEVVMSHSKQWRTQEGMIQELVSQRVATAPNLHQLAIPGYQLLRGKECSIAGSRYIHLVYGNGKKQISMYVLAGNEHELLRRIATKLMPAVRSRFESGYNVTEGDSDRLRILLVSTISKNEEQAIVKTVLQTTS